MRSCMSTIPGAASRVRMAKLRIVSPPFEVQDEQRPAKWKSSRFGRIDDKLLCRLCGGAEADREEH